MGLSNLLNTDSIWMPLILLFVSIFGSSHCLIMCVPIAASQSNGNLNYYHLGRLGSYLVLASAMYYLGQKALNNEVFWVLYGIVFLGYFVWINVKENRSKGCCHRSKVKFKNLFLLGFVNGLLPCGWLFLILMFLSKTQNYFLFLLCVVIFWIGTVPIFHILKLKSVVRKYIPAMKNRALITFLYLVFALYSFSLHYHGVTNHTPKEEYALLCGG